MNLSSTRSPRGSERGAIYVVRLNLRVSYDPVRFEMGWKVGFTQNLPMRINTLMGIHRPGELVAVTLGTRDDEARFHTELSSACMLGGPWGGVGRAREWFRDCPEFDAWLATFPAVWRGSIPSRTGETNSQLKALWADIAGSEQRSEAITVYFCTSGTTLGWELRATCRALVTERDGDTARLRILGDVHGLPTAKTGVEFVVDATTGRQIDGAEAWWQVDDDYLGALRVFDARRELNDAALRAGAGRVR